MQDLKIRKFGLTMKTQRVNESKGQEIRKSLFQN